MSSGLILRRFTKRYFKYATLIKFVTWNYSYLWVLVSNVYNILIFSVMAGTASFMGHFIFATVFSSSLPSKMYIQLYRPINGIVGICFIIYGIKLFLSLL